MIRQLTFAVVALLVSVGFADTWLDESTGYTWTYEEVEDGVSIHGNFLELAVDPEPSGVFTVPETINDKPVVEISWGAFAYCSDVVRFVLPNTLRRLGDSAFYYCTGLTEVVVPESVTNISQYAFNGCSSITKAVLPYVDYRMSYLLPQTSVTNIEVVGTCAETIPYSFSDMGKLETVVLPEGLGRLGGSTFCSCTSLKSFAIPNSVTNIGDMAFVDCGVTNIAIPASVKEIEGYAFYRSALQRVNIPGTVKVVGFGAFWGAEQLKEANVEEGVVSIGGEAFSNCSSLEKVTLPDSIAEIGARTFDECEALEAVTVPASVKTIGTAAFRDCMSLVTVVLQEGLVRIGDNSFAGCYSLTSIRIPKTVEVLGSGCFSSGSIRSITFDGPPPTGLSGAGLSPSVELKYNAKYADLWKGVISSIGFSNAHPYYDENIDGDCFRIVPGGLPHIVCDKNEAIDFAIDCYGSKLWHVSVHYPRGNGCVQDGPVGALINDDLFKYCDHSVMGTGETFTFAFKWYCEIREHFYSYSYGWLKLGTVNGELAILASAVSPTPGALAIGDVHAAEPQEIVARPDISVWKASDQGGWMELIEGCIPRDTEGLVIIPEKIDGKPVKKIGRYAFDGCQRVVDVRIPEGVTEIAECAFAGCTSLMSVNLPNSLTILGKGAFVSCQSLTSITLPSGISKIDRDAFPEGHPLLVHLPKDEANRIIRLFCLDPDHPNALYEPPAVTFVEDLTEEETAAGEFAFPFYFTDHKLFIGNIRRIPVPSFSVAGELKIPAKLAGLSVYGIGDLAFKDCDQLTSIKIPTGVKMVGSAAFADCWRVVSIELPLGITEFDSTAFRGCDSIISATIPGGDVKVFNYLQNADRLRFLSITEGSVEIGENQFFGCWSLETVTFPDTLISIGRSAFEDCNGLRVLNFPANLLTVGERAFANCGGLRTLRVPGSVQFVGDEAFANIGNLKALVLDEGVCGVGSGAFWSCHELERVVFPSTLQFIDDKAFADCPKIKSLDLPEGLMLVDEWAFGDCYDVKTITIPSSLAYIGYRGFNFSKETTVRVAKGDAKWVAELFDAAEIEWVDGQIAECGATTAELIEQADKLVAETFTPEFMQEFAALEPGDAVTISIPNAQPGLFYGVGVATSIEGLAEAVRNAPKERATSQGVELTVVKPAGDSAFFRVVVAEP